MKAIKAISVFFIFSLLLLSKPTSAQWEEGQMNVYFSIPEIALIDVEPSSSGSIHFTVASTGVSGESPRVVQTSDETLWINYSSALSDRIHSRSIVAEILQGLPEGMSMYLEASAYRGLGKGQVGQSAGKVNLTRQPQPIITGLGSCFTGDGINNGHSLSFSIEITDYAKIYAMEESELTVVYTITDN